MHVGCLHVCVCACVTALTAVYMWIRTRARVCALRSQRTARQHAAKGLDATGSCSGWNEKKRQAAGKCWDKISTQAPDANKFPRGPTRIFIFIFIPRLASFVVFPTRVSKARANDAAQGSTRTSTHARDLLSISMGKPVSCAMYPRFPAGLYRDSSWWTSGDSVKNSLPSSS